MSSSQGFQRINALFFVWIRDMSVRSDKRKMCILMFKCPVQTFSVHRPHKMAEKLPTLEEERDSIRRQLPELAVKLRTVGDDRDYEKELLKVQGSLLKRLETLEGQIINPLRTPSATAPAPAPPGNSITLPQVLPLASFLPPPPPLQNSLRQPITIKL